MGRKETHLSTTKHKNNNNNFGNSDINVDQPLQIFPERTGLAKMVVYLDVAFLW